MPSERIQRQIDALLERAEAAIVRREWAAAGEAARAILAIDDANEDAAACVKIAAGNVQGGTTGGPGASPAEPPRSTTGTVAPTPDSFANGRYQMRRFLGEGGKKRVFLAYDTSLDRDVAFA